MKANIHPKQQQVLAKCVCGNEFYFESALDSAVVNLEVCNKCHPFYTKTQKTAAITGRVDSFLRKFQPKPKVITTDKAKPVPKKPNSRSK